MKPKPTQLDTMWDVFDSLDRALMDHLQRADKLIRMMLNDMTMHGVPKQLAEEFLQERIQEMHDMVIKQSESRGKLKTFLPKRYWREGA